MWEALGPGLLGLCLKMALMMCNDSEGMMCDDSEGMMCLYTVSEKSNRSVSELYSLLVLEALLLSYLKLHFYVFETSLFRTSIQ